MLYIQSNGKLNAADVDIDDSNQNFTKQQHIYEILFSIYQWKSAYCLMLILNASFESCFSVAVEECWRWNHESTMT